jgi:hypothetical protein
MGIMLLFPFCPLPGFEPQIGVRLVTSKSMRKLPSYQTPKNFITKSLPINDNLNLNSLSNTRSEPITQTKQAGYSPNTEQLS